MMTTINYIIIVIGIIISLIGILSLFFPGLTRIISLPGNEKFKSIITMIIGVIVIVVGILRLY